MISDETQLVGLLRGRREALGWTQGDLDDRIGWADSYAAKAESPDRRFGRRTIWGLSDFLTWWLQALGLTLVLMDKEQAEALIAGSDAPAIASSQHRAYPNRESCRPPLTKRTLTSRVRFLSVG